MTDLDRRIGARWGVDRDEGGLTMDMEADGFLNVETGKGSGWVKKVLLTK